jgi:hypothetical protein
MSRAIFTPFDLNSELITSALSIQMYASQAPPSASTMRLGRITPVFSNWLNIIRCIEIVEEKCNAKREAFGQRGLLNV